MKLTETIRKLATDFSGLARICGPTVAMRWAAAVARNARTVATTRSLSVADAQMGNGPFEVHLRKYAAHFRIQGPNAFSGIREMYVRDQYLDDGWLSIPPGATVVDLGANMGNFTNLALATDPKVRVVAIEPSATLNDAFQASLSLNPGHRDRATLIRAFVGQPTEQIERVIENQPEYSGAPWITEDELLSRTGPGPIEFLKCDIEGGEFGLFAAESKLLKRTRRVACEVHSFAGDVPSIVHTLAGLGFQLRTTVAESDGSIVIVGKRPDGSMG